MSYTHLSFEEQEVIHDSKIFRLNISDIALKLEKHLSSIYREIKYNQNKLSNYTTTEFKNMERHFNCKVYFMGTSSSWQRSLNEYSNRLIRQYRIKGIYSWYVTQKYLDEIIHKINSRPRKILGYLIANEVFKE